MTERATVVPRALAPQALAQLSFDAARPLLEKLPFPALWIGQDYELRWANAATPLRQPQGKCHECLHGYDKPCDSQGHGPCRSLRAAALGQACEFVHAHRVDGGLELFKVVALPMDEGVLEFHIPIDENFSRDALTGLLNRPAIEQVTRQGIRLMRRLRQQCAVVMLDLDRFKRINDGFGHAAGDTYLRAVGEVLRRETRSTDLVGRWGGEEFLVFMPGCDRRGAGAKVQRLLQALRELRVDFHGSPLHTTTSAGIWAGYPRTRFEHIYEVADAALYEAKAEGRNRFCFAQEHLPPPQAGAQDTRHHTGQFA